MDQPRPASAPKTSSGPRAWATGQAAEQIFPDLFPSTPLPPHGLVPAAPLGGAGGKSPTGQITRLARATLHGHWGQPIGFCVLLGLLYFASQVIPYAGPLVISPILAGCWELGAAIYFLTLIRRGPVRIGMLFDGFKMFGTAFWAYNLRLLLVFSWTVVAAIPGGVVAIIAAVSHAEAAAVASLIFLCAIPALVVGAIKSLSYSQTMYIIADGVETRAAAAITRSRDIMNGHKGRLFVLGLRFIGWISLCLLPVSIGSLCLAPHHIAAWAPLCLLALGIGFLWLQPYMFASYAHFYEDLRSSPPAAASEPTAPLVGSGIA